MASERLSDAERNSIIEEYIVDLACSDVGLMKSNQPCTIGGCECGEVRFPSDFFVDETKPNSNLPLNYEDVPGLLNIAKVMHEEDLSCQAVIDVLHYMDMLGTKDFLQLTADATNDQALFIKSIQKERELRWAESEAALAAAAVAAAGAVEGDAAVVEAAAMPPAHAGDEVAPVAATKAADVGDEASAVDAAKIALNDGEVDVSEDPDIICLNPLNCLAPLTCLDPLIGGERDEELEEGELQSEGFEVLDNQNEHNEDDGDFALEGANEVNSLHLRCEETEVLKEECGELGGWRAVEETAVVKGIEAEGAAAAAGDTGDAVVGVMGGEVEAASEEVVAKSAAVEETAVIKGIEAEGAAAAAGDTGDAVVGVMGGEVEAASEEVVAKSAAVEETAVIKGIEAEGVAAAAGDTGDAAVGAMAKEVAAAPGEVVAKSAAEKEVAGAAADKEVEAFTLIGTGAGSWRLSITDSNDRDVAFEANEAVAAAAEVIVAAAIKEGIEASTLSKTTIHDEKADGADVDHSGNADGKEEDEVLDKIGNLVIDLDEAVDYAAVNNDNEDGDDDGPPQKRIKLDEEDLKCKD